MNETDFCENYWKPYSGHDITSPPLSKQVIYTPFAMVS